MKAGFLALAVALLISPWSAGAVEPQLKAALVKLLDDNPTQSLGLFWQGEGERSANEVLAEMYGEFAMRPLWVTEDGPTAAGRIIFETVSRADAEGLNLDDYGVRGMRKLWDLRIPRALAALDVLLTVALVKYVNDVGEGRLEVREHDPDLFAKAGDRHSKALEVVSLAVSTGDLEAFLTEPVPTHPQYMALRDALARYRSILRAGGWSAVPAGETIHPGDSDPRVPAIRARMQVTDGPVEGAATSLVYDDNLREAVEYFQRRHGLTVDGVIGKKTVAAMNQSPASKIRALEMNMERWRWMARDLGEKYVLVDIAGFTLQGYEGRDVILEMPVVVGKYQHETPIFSDRIRYLEFNPYWNITPTIAQNEMLPKLKDDPGYLQKQHIRVFESWQSDARELDPHAVDWHSIGNGIRGMKLRQDPGPWNALGTVKFMFPNEYDVYLHDTPARSKFSRAVRAFSHGCVRVAEPSKLAEFVLGGESEGWAEVNVAEVVEKGERQVVRLKEPLPVHITYQTVWVDAAGRIRFSPDIYGRDSKLEAALYRIGAFAVLN